jgi:hypothetical protein
MIGLILALAFVGFIVYLIVTFIPMPQVIKTAILVLVAICMIYYVMGAFGIVDIPIPRMRH